MTVGERIRSIRIRKGLTQREVALQCDMADSAIRKYESGRVNPKIETLRKIANALDVDINFLINGQTLEQRDEAYKEKINSRFESGRITAEILSVLEELNPQAKQKILDYAIDLAKIPEYKK